MKEKSFDEYYKTSPYTLCSWSPKSDLGCHDLFLYTEKLSSTRLFEINYFCNYFPKRILKKCVYLRELLLIEQAENYKAWNYYRSNRVTPGRKLIKMPFSKSFPKIYVRPLLNRYIRTFFEPMVYFNELCQKSQTYRENIVIQIVLCGILFCICEIA